MDDESTPSDDGLLNNKDAITLLDNRLRKLEQTIAFVGGGTIVGSILILGFLGFTSFHQIPQAIRNAVDEYVEKQDPQFAKKLKEHRQSAKDAAEAATVSAEKTHQILDQLQERGTLLRIESGNIDLHKDKHPDLRRTDQCPSVRGEIGKRIEFSNPFKKPPRVVLSLNLLDHVIDKNPQAKVDQNLRIRADIVEPPDTHGFQYNLNTWCHTDIWAVRASWIAYGY